MKKLVKSLKFWSRKKKKKKDMSRKNIHNNIPTSTTCHHCCCPSAPPLPPWYDMSQHNHDEHPEPLSYPSQPQFVSNEIVVDDKIGASLYSREVLPTVSSSYQQYTVVNPVYGLPVVSQAPRRERSAGVFGCVFNSGAYLVRCFCPCFSIRDGY